MNTIFGYSGDGESYRGLCATREEALHEAGLDPEMAGFEKLYVAEMRRPRDPAHLIDADTLIEAVCMHEDYDNEHSDWPEFPEGKEEQLKLELTNELRRAFGMWLDQKEMQPRHWMVMEDTVQTHLWPPEKNND